jgi:hypothetical protein
MGKLNSFLLSWSFVLNRPTLSISMCRSRYEVQLSVSCNQINTTGATSGAGTAYPSGAPALTPVFSGVRVTRILVLYVYFVDRCLSCCTFYKPLISREWGNDWKVLTTSGTYPWSFISQIFDIDSVGRLRTKLYDKRNEFNFPIVNFPFICSKIPAAPVYEVTITSTTSPGLWTQVLRKGRQFLLH